MDQPNTGVTLTLNTDNTTCLCYRQRKTEPIPDTIINGSKLIHIFNILMHYVAAAGAGKIKEDKLWQFGDKMLHLEKC